MDWPREIATMAYVKQAIRACDVRNLWPYQLPTLAATSEQIQAAERHLGFRLDAEYSSFLCHANGWRGFYQSVDLFGTDDLIAGERMGRARKMLADVEPSVVSASGVRKDDLLPIGATSADLDLFVLTTPGDESPGRVIWFAGTEIQRFENFGEFFLSMVDYNRSELTALQNALPGDHTQG